jgi:hypothetical protein
MYSIEAGTRVFSELCSRCDCTSVVLDDPVTQKGLSLFFNRHDPKKYIHPDTLNRGVCNIPELGNIMKEFKLDTTTGRGVAKYDTLYEHSMWAYKAAVHMVSTKRVVLDIAGGIPEEYHSIFQLSAFLHDVGKATGDKVYWRKPGHSIEGYKMLTPGTDNIPTGLGQHLTEYLSRKCDISPEEVAICAIASHMHYNISDVFDYHDGLSQAFTPNMYVIKLLAAIGNSGYNLDPVIVFRICRGVSYADVEGHEDASVSPVGMLGSDSKTMNKVVERYSIGFFLTESIERIVKRTISTGTVVVDQRSGICLYKMSNKGDSKVNRDVTVLRIHDQETMERITKQGVFSSTDTISQSTLNKATDMDMKTAHEAIQNHIIMDAKINAAKAVPHSLSEPSTHDIHDTWKSSNKDLDQLVNELKQVFGESAVVGLPDVFASTDITSHVDNVLLTRAKSILADRDIIVVQHIETFVNNVSGEDFPNVTMSPYGLVSAAMVSGWTDLLVSLVSQIAIDKIHSCGCVDVESAEALDFGPNHGVVFLKEGIVSETCPCITAEYRPLPGSQIQHQNKTHQPKVCRSTR